MRICLVSQEYPPDTARGGIGTQTWNKARALAGRGHEVHVLAAAARPGPDPATTAQDGVTVHRIQTPGTSFPVYGQAAYWVGYSWAVYNHLSRLMAAAAFDVLDFAEYGGEAFAYLLDRTPWNWAPVAVQLHGPLSLFADKVGWPERGTDLYDWGTSMEELCIRRADALMACSANIADFTASRHGVAREAIAVVHCGVDADAFTPPPARPAPHRPTVLFVGNIAANKGVLTTLDAVLRLRSRHPDLRLRLAGKGDDDLLRDIGQRAAQAGAGDCIEVLGFAGREALPDLYRAADVFCSPAQYEPGVANVYIEAMACGCPVVASTAGGAPDAVVSGETGLLVNPGDVEATAQALDRLLTDAALRQRMGRAARRRVDEYFCMARYTDRVLAVYEAAIANGGRKRAQLENGWQT